MDKSFWGPSTWCMIHCAAASYRPENRASFKQFIYSLTQLLPCDICKQHLTKNLKTIPLTDNVLRDNRSALMWSYFLHDLVNKQLNKPSSPPFSAVENHYMSVVKNNQAWGPCFWRAMHAFASAYQSTPQSVVAFKNFIYSLTGVLPCIPCRDSYQSKLSVIPLTNNYFKDGNTLFMWTYHLHSLVNKELGKMTPPYQTIKSEYFNDNVCKSCSSSFS